MENTIENKLRFFAQYFGTDTGRKDTHPNLKYVINSHVIESIWYIELKPLSSISDEDAIELSYRLGQVVGLDNIIQENTTGLVKKVIENYTAIDCLWMLPARFTDKARELGYAIDWNEVSVKQQIEYNWIKLIN